MRNNIISEDSYNEELLNDLISDINKDVVENKKRIVKLYKGVRSYFYNGVLILPLSVIGTSLLSIEKHLGSKHNAQYCRLADYENSVGKLSKGDLLRWLYLRKNGLMNAMFVCLSEDITIDTKH